MQVLDLASNMLTGPIEQLLTGLPLLRVLRVNNNQLTGSLPSRFGSTHIEVRSTPILGRQSLSVAQGSLAFSRHTAT